MWDGYLEALPNGVELKASFELLEDLVQSGAADFPRLEHACSRDPNLQALLAGARGGLSLADVLPGLSGFSRGDGWETSGMLGGSGYNIYVRHRVLAAVLAADCRMACQID